MCEDKGYMIDMDVSENNGYPHFHTPSHDPFL